MSSFYLWVLENFQAVASQVSTLMSDSHQPFPDGEGQGQGQPAEVGCCVKESAKAGVSFARIVRKLQSLKREMNSLTAGLAELTDAQQRHREQTERSSEDSRLRINFMNDRILEIRELTGPRGLSAAHLARIKKVKRGSIFEDKTENLSEEPGKGRI